MRPHKLLKSLEREISDFEVSCDFQGFTTHFISPYFSPFVFRSHAVSGPSLNSVSLNSSIARIGVRGKPKGESVVSKFDVWSLEFHLWARLSRTSSTRVPSSPK